MELSSLWKSILSIPSTIFYILAPECIWFHNSELILVLYIHYYFHPLIIYLFLQDVTDFSRYTDPKFLPVPGYFSRSYDCHDHLVDFRWYRQVLHDS